jgi:hypothetical protein
MPLIRLLTSVQGGGPVAGDPGQLLDVDEPTALIWADGERAELVDAVVAGSDVIVTGLDVGEVVEPSPAPPAEVVESPAIPAEVVESPAIPAVPAAASARTRTRPRR